MKSEIKNRLYKTAKIIWTVLGALILLWILYWYVQMVTIGNLGVLAIAVLFGAGIYLFLIYIAITTLFLIIKFAFKKAKWK